MREKILLAGDMSTSKTTSLIQLAIQFPDKIVAILDPDDGVAKVLSELGMDGEALPNLSIIKVTPDWEAMISAYRMLKTVLKEGDWLCFDMMGRFWDFAQNFFSKSVFGMSTSEHLVMLRSQAKSTSFSGFDGLMDWSVIKRMHNEELVDDAVVWSQFNVMATTSIGSYLPVEKVPKAGLEGFLAKEFGVKLEGEKHNPYRFDTIALLQRKADKSYTFRIVKDKGRAIDPMREIPFTNSSFTYEYFKMRGELT